MPTDLEHSSGFPMGLRSKNLLIANSPRPQSAGDLPGSAAWPYAGFVRQETESRPGATSLYSAASVPRVHG